MKFLALDIGDYFIQWDNDDGYYFMYKKNTEYDAYYVDSKLIERDYGVIPFHCDEIVYKVVI